MKNLPKEIADRLWEICQSIADEINQRNRYFDEDEGRTEEPDYVFLETNANGYYVDEHERTVSFSFTVMNDKFWDDWSFSQLKREFGLDLKEYLD